MLRVLMRGAMKEDIETFSKVASYEKDTAYKDYIDKIYQVSVTANRELYNQIKKEDPKMCEALRELMKDELEEREARGEARGEKRGENKLADLIQKLIKYDRNDEIDRATSDQDYRMQLYEEFHMA